MATDIAHEGIRKILNLLDEDEIKQLAITSTQHNLKPELMRSKEEAMEIVIKYSSDYATILNRKSVKREYLFQYLHQNKIFITPPITKLLLIQKILEYWTISSNDKQELCAKPETEEENQDVTLMANKFTEWFYNMLNSDVPLGEEHFWNDCNLQINLISSTSTVEDSVENDPKQIVTTLFKTKNEHGLFFNPNLTSDGVFGKINAHGLVLIFVCGTLHTRDNCVGIFEQMFSLARDPFCENNWKIKNTRLNLRSKEVTEIPKLCDNTDVLLCLTD